MPLQHYHRPHLFQYSHPWFHFLFFFIKYQCSRIGADTNLSM
jgi:hypothetical protein